MEMQRIPIPKEVYDILKTKGYPGIYSQITYYLMEPTKNSSNDQETVRHGFECDHPAFYTEGGAIGRTLARRRRVATDRLALAPEYLNILPGLNANLRRVADVLLDAFRQTFDTPIISRDLTNRCSAKLEDFDQAKASCYVGRLLELGFLINVGPVPTEDTHHEPAIDADA